MSPFDQPSDNSEKSPTIARRLLPGEIIGRRYKVVAHIKSGRYCSVYKVEQVAMKKILALKTLDRFLGSDTAWKTFQFEAKAAEQLNHRNLVRVLDYGTIDEVQPYVVMEFLKGDTLAKFLSQSGMVDVKTALKIIIPLCQGLAYAHEQGVIHRDVKPSNIFLVPTADAFVPRVADFGIAKACEFDAETDSDEVFGDPLYMSFEQCKGLRIDNRTDVYSLGCMLFEALTGAPPFKGKTVPEIMQHASAAPSLQEGSGGRKFPYALEQIVKQMLAKDPLERPEFSSIVPDLTAIQEAKLLSGGGKSETKGSGNKKTIIAVSIVGVVLIGGLVVAGTMFQKKPPPAKVAKPVGKSPEELAKELIDTKLRSYPVIHKLKTETLLDFGDLPQIGFVRDLTDDPSFKQNQNAIKVVKFPENSRIVLSMPLSFLVQHPAALQNFKELHGLEITADEGAATPDAIPDAACVWIKDMNGLEMLDLHSVLLTDKQLELVGLDGMPQLRSLNVDVDGAELAKMHGLERLDELYIGQPGSGAGFKNVTRVLKALARSNSLKIFGAPNAGLTDSDLHLIGKFATLKRLYIEENDDIHDKGLSELSGLKSLYLIDLRNCKSITTKAIDALSQLPKLKIIVLSKSSFTDSEKTLWRNAFPKMVHFKDKDVKADAPSAAPPAATQTASPAATQTASPAATQTASPAATQTASPAATQTGSPPPTQTASPAATQTASPAATQTGSPPPTQTAPPPAASPQTVSPSAKK